VSDQRCGHGKSKSTNERILEGGEPGREVGWGSRGRSSHKLAIKKRKNLPSKRHRGVSAKGTKETNKPVGPYSEQRDA